MFATTDKKEPNAQPKATPRHPPTYLVGPEVFGGEPWDPGFGCMDWAFEHALERLETESVMHVLEMLGVLEG